MGISYNEFKTVFVRSAQSVLNNNFVGIDDNEKFEDVGLDSLDRMNLLLELEEQLELDLGELDLEEQNTLELLYKSVVGSYK